MTGGTGFQIAGIASGRNWHGMSRLEADTEKLNWSVFLGTVSLLALCWQTQTCLPGGQRQGCQPYRSQQRAPRPEWPAPPLSAPSSAASCSGCPCAWRTPLLYLHNPLPHISREHNTQQGLLKHGLPLLQQSGGHLYYTCPVRCHTSTADLMLGKACSSTEYPYFSG